MKRTLLIALALSLLAASAAWAKVPLSFGGAAAAPPSTGNAAYILGLDATTQGYWIGHYGADGYDIPLIASATPSYATVAVTGATTSVGAGGYAAIPQNPDGTQGSNFNWWAGGAVDINITDGRAHRVTMYVADLYGNGLVGQYIAKDGGSGATLLTSNMSDGRTGIYQSFLVTGHVTLSNTYWLNAVYFDPPAPAVGQLDYAIANSGGAAVPLNITAPSEPGATLTASVASLPANGTVTLADGTPVTVSESLTPAQLAGLKVTPSALSATAASTFTYTVSDGTNATTGSLPVVVEVLPTPPAVSSCAATGYEQAGSVTSDSGAMSVLVPKSGVLPSEVGVLVNDANVISIITAQYYVAKHGIPPGNVFHFSYPFVQNDFSNYGMPAAAFNSILDMVNASSTPIQMLALTWNEPWYQTSGNVLGSSFFYNTAHPPTLGSAAQTGWNGNDSTYADSAFVEPFSDLGVRPNMYVAGLSLSDALALIDRGAAGQTTMPDNTNSQMIFVITSDLVRSAPRLADEALETVPYWTSSGAQTAICKDNYYTTPTVGCTANGGSDYITGASNIVVMEGGWGGAPIPGMTSNTYLPGAEVDGLTSDMGSLLPPAKFEGTILSIIHDGATGSYGWSGEPTATESRFTTASILTKSYFGGGTLGEAVLKSVSDPGNMNAVGDPLARPWGTTATFSGGTFTLKTSILPPSGSTTYSLTAASSCGGTYSTLQSGIHPDATRLKFKTITDTGGFHPFYKVTSP